MRYNQPGEIIEIIVRDFSGAKIDSYKFRLNEVDKIRRFFDALKKKYAIDTSPIDRDIDWLDKTRW